MSMSPQTTPLSLQLFSFVKQFAGIIEKHLVLGLTYHGLTGVKKDLPLQVPAPIPHISRT